MNRSLDQIVRDTIGNQTWQIVQLVAQLEALQEENDQLKEALKKAKEGKEEAA